jgi:squalene synthase HpnC
VTFQDALAQYGPTSTGPTLTPAQAEAYCRRLAAEHYENFPVLSRFLPKALRQDFANIYAYCRWSDDLGDEIHDPSRSLELFDWWETELGRCFDGAATHPVMRALSATVSRHRIPRQPFRDLLTAFRRDQRQTRYETFADLLDYCRYSANPVGRLVLYVCGRHSPSNAELSDAICTGLQLANFCQDVGIDAAKGRIYLPAEDRRCFGAHESDILEGRCTPAFVNLLRFEVERTESYLQSGLPLVSRMAGRLKVVVAAFACGGLAILGKIKAGGYDVLSCRPRLSTTDIIRVFWRALWQCVLPQQVNRPLLTTVETSSAAKTPV